MKQNSLKATVALICYREKEKLAPLLEDLTKQTAFQQIGEALLAQNGHCRQTLQTAQSFVDRLPLKIIPHPSNNIGQARALLTDTAQFDFIAWTDSDCRLPSSWLEELLRHLINNPKAVAVGGPNRLAEDKSWKRAINLSLSHPLGHGWSPQAWRVIKKTRVSHIPTTNGLFLKKGIISAGNFATKHKTTGEDLNLGWRLSRQGELYLFPGPLVINNYADSYWENLRRLFTFGKARAYHIRLSFWPVGLFFPTMAGLLIAGVWIKYFFLPVIGYLVILLLASLQVYSKSKQRTSFALPLFWLLQQSAYSLGAVAGLLRRALTGL